jgi:hypothetical protein
METQMSKTTTTNHQPAARPQTPEPKGCPDDCNLDHRVTVYARRHGIDPSTIYRWEKKGFPILRTPVGTRINCKQARAFMRGNSTS